MVTEVGSYVTAVAGNQQRVRCTKRLYSGSDDIMVESHGGGCHHYRPGAATCVSATTRLRHTAPPAVSKPKKEARKRIDSKNRASFSRFPFAE